MAITDNECKIVGVKIGELRANLLGGERVEVKYAFVDKSGATHGWSSTFVPWSASTMEKFRDFVASAEQDLLGLHFLFEGDTRREEDDGHRIAIEGSGEL